MLWCFLSFLTFRVTAFASFFPFIVLNVSKLAFLGGNLYDEVESCLSFLHCTQNPVIFLF